MAHGPALLTQVLQGSTTGEKVDLLPYENDFGKWQKTPGFIFLSLVYFSCVRAILSYSKWASFLGGRVGWVRMGYPGPGYSMAVGAAGL